MKHISMKGLSIMMNRRIPVLMSEWGVDNPIKLVGTADNPRKTEPLIVISLELKNGETMLEVLEQLPEYKNSEYKTSELVEAISDEFIAALALISAMNDKVPIPGALRTIAKESSKSEIHDISFMKEINFDDPEECSAAFCYFSIFHHIGNEEHQEIHISPKECINRIKKLDESVPNLPWEKMDDNPLVILLGTDFDPGDDGRSYTMYSHSDHFKILEPFFRFAFTESDDAVYNHELCSQQEWKFYPVSKEHRELMEYFLGAHENTVASIVKFTEGHTKKEIYEQLFGFLQESVFPTTRYSETSSAQCFEESAVEVGLNGRWHWGNRFEASAVLLQCFSRIFLSLASKGAFDGNESHRAQNWLAIFSDSLPDSFDMPSFTIFVEALAEGVEQGIVSAEEALELLSQFDSQEWPHYEGQRKLMRSKVFFSWVVFKLSQTVSPGNAISLLGQSKIFHKSPQNAENEELTEKEWKRFITAFEECPEASYEWLYMVVKTETFSDDDEETSKTKKKKKPAKKQNSGNGSFIPLLPDESPIQEIVKDWYKSDWGVMGFPNLFDD